MLPARSGVATAWKTADLTGLSRPELDHYVGSNLHHSCLTVFKLLAVQPPLALGSQIPEES